jgi:CRP-like cAMP-binding protein
MLILENIKKVISLTPEEETSFVSLLQERNYKKKDKLLKPGEVCCGVWFVNKGCLRSYQTDYDGVEHNLYFSIEDWWASDLYSYIGLIPSLQCIEALEDTTTLYLSKENNEKLYTLIPKFERFFRIKIEKNLVANQQLLLDRMSKTAQERFLKFEQRYPQLITRIAQKHIASYLGVTPEFLSKMKSELYKRK